MPPRPADPYADPANDPYNLLRYIPTDSLTGFAHGAIMLVAIVQLALVWKYKTWWMLVLPISAWIFTEGFAMRLVLARSPESRNAFIVQSTLTVLTPCAFIAVDYMLLGRIARFLGTEKHMIVMPSRITKIFIFSDVATFMIQATGSSLTIINTSNVKLGSNIFLGGLILQAASFGFFTIMFAIWMRRVCTSEPHIWSQDRAKKWYNDWRALAGALVVSCIGILVRSGYRIAEASQGYFGTLATTEWVFYAFDTLPLFIAIAVYIPFWPGRFIPRVNAQGEALKDRHELAPLPDIAPADKPRAV
ncbi:RTA1-domain-containing protein [Exidia glandulosa HHB12029]|uniref:RTA1-domain-containing protein n=1 Tax=Exidia glandulosa HHB12029 TaxID=1314781 RepID=A0A166B2U5_EXIGL|nr:RTA1-domain-containing protein [Exidia glandulosa HHB12029]